MHTLDLFNLSGKTAVVTGCDTGLGMGMAIALAEAGADIVGASIVEDYAAIKEAIKATGRKFTYHRVDISDRDALYAFITKVKAESERIDILVNNAGIIMRKPAAEHPDEYWDKVVDINLNAQFYFGS
jgi:2-deoxy-D-gluconate 3-dehydrogenase